MRTRIQWTTRQILQIAESLADLFERYYPGQDWNAGHGGVGMKEVERLLPDAQKVLEPHYHRKYFVKAQLIEFSAQVANILRNRQLEAEKKRMLCDDVPSQVLLDVLAERMGNAVVDRILTKKWAEVLQRVDAKVEQMMNMQFDHFRKMMRHDPTLKASDVVKREIPTYAVVGVNAAQIRSVQEYFGDQCNFEFVTKDEPHRVSSACKGRITFCMRFVNESLSSKAKAASAEMHWINGNATDLKRVIEVQLKEFNSLNQQ